MADDTVRARIAKLAASRTMPDGRPFPTDQKGLAKVFGVTYETWRQWGKVGAIVPSRPRAQRIAALLQVPPETFMHGVPYADEEPANAPSPAALRIARAYEAAPAELRKAFEAIAAAVSQSGEFGAPSGDHDHLGGKAA